MDNRCNPLATRGACRSDARKAADRSARNSENDGDNQGLRVAAIAFDSSQDSLGAPSHLDTGMDSLEEGIARIISKISAMEASKRTENSDKNTSENVNLRGIGDGRGLKPNNNATKTYTPGAIASEVQAHTVFDDLLGRPLAQKEPSS